MRLIHELSINHISPINNDLNNWYKEDAERVISLQEQGRRESRTYYTVLTYLAALTLLSLALTIWINNQSIVKPVLRIKAITEKLAKGDLKQQIDVTNDDEIGELARDITNMASSLDSINQKLNDAARTDGLTGILNRRSCDEVLEQHFNAALRYDMIFSVVMLDIDHFKSVNDMHGHAAGDQTLRTFAAICQEQIRDCDFIFRFGGEEFLVLLPNTDKNDSMVVAERIRKSIRNATIELEDKKIKITASLGISSFPEDGLEQGELIRNADNALYKAKDNGRNQSVAFEKPLLI
jgi:diguanylate cyclase (GGDEF)-like protein